MQSQGGSDPQFENHQPRGLGEGQYLGLNFEPQMLDKYFMTELHPHPQEIKSTQEDLWRLCVNTLPSN